jgi:hypothetical protein
MKYGLLKYSSYNKRFFNIGDYIQSLAAKQFLPKVDIFLDRDNDLADYREDELEMIMNGWFMHNPEKWPPSDKIKPLFVSFHIAPSVEEVMLSPKGVDYLRQYSPIGCRDNYTVEVLRKHSIGAYYSGCLTLTLDDTYHITTERENIYFVDVLFNFNGLQKLINSPRLYYKDLKKTKQPFQNKKNILSKIFDADILNNAQSLTHIIKSSHIVSDEDRFRYADYLLKKYASAKLVVTSRIHCALPCLGMGIPVIFINGGFLEKGDQTRINSFRNIFNQIDVMDNEIVANFDLSNINDIQNPTNHLELSKNLKNICSSFIK